MFKTITENVAKAALGIVSDSWEKKAKEKQQKLLSHIVEYTKDFPLDSYYYIVFENTRSVSGFLTGQTYEDSYSVFLNGSSQIYHVTMSEGKCLFYEKKQPNKKIAEIHPVCKISIGERNYQIKIGNSISDRIVGSSKKQKQFQNVKEGIKSTFNPEFIYNYQSCDWRVITKSYGRETTIESFSKGIIATIRHFGRNLLVYTPGTPIQLPILIGAFFSIIDTSYHRVGGE